MEHNRRNQEPRRGDENFTKSLYSIVQNSRNQEPRRGDENYPVPLFQYSSLFVEIRNPVEGTKTTPALSYHRAFRFRRNQEPRRGDENYLTHRCNHYFCMQKLGTPQRGRKRRCLCYCSCYHFVEIRNPVEGTKTIFRNISRNWILGRNQEPRRGDENSRPVSHTGTPVFQQKLGTPQRGRKRIKIAYIK